MLNVARKTAAAARRVFEAGARPRLNVARKTAASARALVAGCVVWAAILATAAIGVAAESDATFETRRGPFIVRADFDLTSIENELRELDSLCDELSRTFRLPKLRENVVVRVFRDEAAWREYWNRNFAPTPFRRALYDRKNYLFDRDDSPGRVYLCVNPLFLNDLRHECSHAVLASALGRSVPIWLDEGIAEYFEQPPRERLTNADWRALTAERLRSGQFSSLESLEKIAGMNEMTSVKYGDSWAWVCWFLNGPEAVRDVLPQYLNDLAARKLLTTKPSKRLKEIARSGAAERSLRRFYALEAPPSVAPSPRVGVPLSAAPSPRVGVPPSVAPSPRGGAPSSRSRSSGLAFGVDNASGGGGWIPGPIR